MSRKKRNILKHLSIIILLFIASIVGVLYFVYNVTSVNELSWDDEEKAITFTPFVRTSNNTIVKRKEHELRNALNKIGNKEPIVSVIRTSNDFNQDIPFTVD